MATAGSANPTPVENSRSYNIIHNQPLSINTHSQSTRIKGAALSIPQRASSTQQQTPSRHAATDGSLPPAAHENPNIVHTSKRKPTKESLNQPQIEVMQKSTSRQHHSTRQRRHLPSMTTTEADGAVPIQDSRYNVAKTSKSRTTIPAASGNWILGKTIGAGSMGKVKLARRNECGEQVAVKIVPRGATDESQNQSKADRERADHSKEVRTAREAAIMTLLDHPYICAMKDVVRTTYHWYMLFEYVNGGQMLDYIISHGRLKEKQARKFSRQIASALDYCHRNSIVHRDLKIENILISKTGDIKIIDFGLSNMFNPRNHLKTFCGSLYFAAPELLQAKQYTGPEVDIWSFGIVLYVLVCGKVPFDDQSMPALHAKIKKGIVDYPSWLSPECKNLISRMLVTDPRQRACLQEIMNHTWIVKGFGSAPENYLPVREPLQLPLDPHVIQAMTGFDFGPPEIIQARLTEVLESQEYIRAVRVAAQEREAQGPAKDQEKKRGFGFDFYRRNYSNSRDTLTAPSSEGILPTGNDPVNAFHPLVSVYHLVREKQERERLTSNFSAKKMQHVPDITTQQALEISAPKLAHTNTASYEMSGENPTGGRSRPRARTHGEDEIAEKLKNIKFVESPGLNSISTPEPSPGHIRKESTASVILRRFSTRRRKENQDRSRPPLVTIHHPNESTIQRKSFSVRRTKDRDVHGLLSARFPTRSSQPQHISSPHSPQAGKPSSRSTNDLARSSSMNSTDFRSRDRRRFAVESSACPRVTYKEPLPVNNSENSIRAKDASRDTIQHSPHLNSKTAYRAKSLGHARRESIQARRACREVRGNHLREENDPEAGDTSGFSNERIDHADNLKPVFLKGLFSVSTTSTKPVHVIRADIIRVLKQHSVKFREIRGGFSCRHTPSIDLKKVYDLPPSTHNNHTPGHRRKISFGGLIGVSSDRDRDEFRDSERAPRTFRTPTRHRRGASYTNSDISDESSNKDDPGTNMGVIGETSTHVQSELSGSMILEFEIFIVKVPLLSLHGIQFKRLAGGTWQYKNMADQILRELRL
ncbi:BgTH12-02893 [Blumeria graminis f. sp. triticale]|nr:BgTH12-02893 [Blumeria graminis f. sp. triticale]